MLYGFDAAACPTVNRIVDHCLTLDAFTATAPSKQPDAQQKH
jgi:hypothetical protein